MWMYTGVSVASFVTAGVFWATFHKYDDEEEEMNKLDADDAWIGKPGVEKQVQ